MKKTLAAIAILAIAGSAFASFGTLQSESTSGANKYCKYSNGVVLTIESWKLCPVTSN